MFPEVNLAFLAPDIIESIITGHQPADFDVVDCTPEVGQNMLE